MISLSMIVKDETDSLIKLNHSLADIPFQEKVAVFTGTNPRTPILLKKMGFKIHEFEWTDNFSKARNFSLSKCKGDWLMWVDADDTVENGAQINSVLKEALEKNCNSIGAEYLYDFDAPIWRERLVKRDEFEWQASIHEALFPKKDERRLNTNKFRVIQDHKLNSEKERLSRNLRISEKAYLEKEGLQSIYSYGLSLFETGNYKHAAKVFEEYLANSVHPQYGYNAILKIAYIHMFNKNEEKCLKWCDHGLHFFPQIGEAMFIKAFLMCRLKRWIEAMQLFSEAFKLKEPIDWVVTVNKNIYHKVAPTVFEFARSKMTGQRPEFNKEQTQIIFDVCGQGA